MSEMWMYGPDYPQGDDLSEEEEEEEEEEDYDDFAIPLPIIRSTSLNSSELDPSKPHRLDINITLKKIEAESPLLPIKEQSLTETDNNVNTTSTLPPTIPASTPARSDKSISFDISPNRLSQELPATPNESSPPYYGSRKRFSIPALLPSARKFSIENIKQPLQTLLGISEEQCRRRNSQPNLKRYRCREQAPRRRDRCYSHQFYSMTTPSTSPARKLSHSFNLYPKDSFYNIEGKAPKSSSKMQAKVDAVGRVTGEWGKWQLRTVLLIFLCKIPSSWFMACIIFTAPAPRHGEFFCKPPLQIGVKNQTAWIKVSHPQKEEADDQEFSIDFCNVYKDAQEHAHIYYHYENLDDEPRVWEEPENSKDVIPCTQFEHQAQFHSVITQYDLVCSRDILVSVTQFFHLFGVLTGGILANHLLKYFSPRNVMLFGMVTQIFCGNLTGLVASYELHVFFRCLSAVCCAQMYTAGGMIMADITGGTYKTCVSTLFEQFWSIGVIMLPGVASFFSSWTHLYMAISWPTVILIYVWQWIPDSPRWMVARGRVLEAKLILIKCAEMNGTRYSLPHDIDQQLQLQAQTALDALPPESWWAIWKGDNARIRHVICVHLCWSIYIVVYYGMLLNIRSFSREHLQINTVIAGFSEIIGTFIGLFLILKTKRKWLWTGLFNIIAGCIAYMGWLVPRNIELDNRVALLMLTAMISKIAISCTLAILTTCTVELVHNEAKKVFAFSTICWARFWLLGAPFVGATVVFGQLVPQTAFASLAIVGGILSTLIFSPRTIPKKASSQVTSNMAAATQISTDGGIDNKGYSKGPIFNSISAKLTTQQSNLPPQLMPGIWTTKNHDETFPI